MINVMLSEGFLFSFTEQNVIKFIHNAFMYHFMISDLLNFVFTNRNLSITECVQFKRLKILDCFLLDESSPSDVLTLHCPCFIEGVNL